MNVNPCDFCFSFSPSCSVTGFTTPPPLADIAVGAEVVGLEVGAACGFAVCGTPCSDGTCTRPPVEPVANPAGLVPVTAWGLVKPPNENPLVRLNF